MTKAEHVAEAERYLALIKDGGRYADNLNINTHLAKIHALLAVALDA